MLVEKIPSASADPPCRVYLQSPAIRGGPHDGNLSVESGFLPARIAVSPLGQTHSPWEELASALPRHVFCESIRRKLDRLPILPTNAATLPGHQLSRAAVILAALACAYLRFGLDRMLANGPSELGDRLPDSISIPWRQVLKRLGRPSMYPSLDDRVLNNFTLKDNDRVGPQGEYAIADVTVENMVLLVPMFGNEAERVFFATFVEVHAVTTPIIGEICNIQSAIGRYGLDGSAKVICSLEKIATCTRRANAALHKLTALKSSKTYCDPLLWARTIALLPGRPLHYESGSMMASAMPFVQVMDRLVGRRLFETKYGQFSTKFWDRCTSKKLSGFLSAMQRVELRDYVKQACAAKSAQHRPLAECFFDLVEQYAGRNGFLGTHIGKSFHYLRLSKAAPRPDYNKPSTALASKWKLPTAERSRGRNVVVGAMPDSVLPQVVPQFSLLDLVKHRFAHDAWVAIGSDIFDVTQFLSRHPGGREIISLYIGRDASADFALIPNHSWSPVRQVLQRMKVGCLQPLQSADRVKSWLRAIDVAVLMHNGCQIQMDHDVGLTERLVYCGQSYLQLVSEEIENALALIGANVTHVRPMGIRRIQIQSRAVSSRVKLHLKSAVGSSEPDAKLAILDHLHVAGLEVINKLIQRCSIAISDAEAVGPGSKWDELLHVKEAVAIVDTWLQQEASRWQCPLASGTRPMNPS